MDKERVKELSIKAMDLRKVVLEMIMKSGGGHIGGDFSVMETLVLALMIAFLTWIAKRYRNFSLLRSIE